MRVADELTSHGWEGVCSGDDDRGKDEACTVCAFRGWSNEKVALRPFCELNLVYVQAKSHFFIGADNVAPTTRGNEGRTTRLLIEDDGCFRLKETGMSGKSTKPSRWVRRCCCVRHNVPPPSSPSPSKGIHGSVASVGHDCEAAVQVLFSALPIGTK